MNYDVIVIGAGIGGLTAAALLAHDGYRVLVLESHIEPGGCASSYERRRPNGERYVFDVGATLFAGFTPGGAHHWVAQQLGISWPVRRLEPASVFISAHPADDPTRAPHGQRAVTVSTHTDAERWWRWHSDDPARYRAEKAAMAERMLDTVERALPGIRRHIRYQQAGTPISFWRYTRRHQGMVGGLPQRPWSTGLFSLGPRAAGVGGLWLVGDSTFPGQSTAAVTQSAIRVYSAIWGERL